MITQRLFGNYVFIHINKCGGTSVESALRIPMKLHDTALEWRRKVGFRRWEQAFTFSIVRHPYSRAISFYSFRVENNETGLGRNPIPLNEWIRRAYRDREPQYHDEPRWFQPCTAWLSDDTGALMVDFVARLESIREDWPVIQTRIGTKAVLPHENATRSKLAWSALDRGARRILDDRFQSDFESFGYRPAACTGAA